MLHKETDIEDAKRFFHHSTSGLEGNPDGFGLLPDSSKVASVKETRIDKYTIPKKGLQNEHVYNLVKNELRLDGNPVLNLASFVNTFTDEFAQKLIDENLNKNLADNDEYPQLIQMNERCISMLAKLWQSDTDKDTALGCATTGSSEAIMLGGLAMKRQWEKKMKAANKSIEKPNIIMSSACQVALEKFARYFDVECRLVPVDTEHGFHLNPNKLWDYVNENTIGIFVILGTTYTGHLENIEQVGEVLDRIEAENTEWSNKNIPIHVDGASGGFIVPFAFTESQMSKYGLGRWGFSHPRVVSINTSGHKFGLTTPGLGWIVWKDDEYLLPELRFKLKYLGGIEETFNLNFSRPGFQVIHQYYNFLTLGQQGYYKKFNQSIFVARAFAWKLLEDPDMKGIFEVVSCLHENLENSAVADSLDDYWKQPHEYKPGIPLCAFKLSEKFKSEHPEIPQAIISTLLRQRGWIIPNYPLPESTDGSDKKEVLRVVFRIEMALDMALLLVRDIFEVVEKLIKSYEYLTVRADNDNHAIFKVLSTLSNASIEDLAPEPTESQKEKEKHVKKNYRGTC
ncbi:unnamed protein product [Kluyveromyces dobzhanskii CBS 2104]|uniref:Glutamate decarboxylase n=1 Tax=Kluyveromyces dobzhanskii CBS 2104 TaxID=1427455 RepID=A0A0A8L005_9SACH|nr:unnamed protein product [Kluyveromyces dobzhanskii CBS 2104]